MQLTFYGHFSGGGSLVGIDRALVREWRAAGHQVGTVDLRKLNPHRPTLDEARTRVGLVHGFPEWLAIVPRYDMTVSYLWVEFPPLPPHWARVTNRHAHVVLTPSEHSRRLLHAGGIDRPVLLAPHGLEPCFQARLGDGHRDLHAPLRFLHFCSALRSARKGTEPLLEAWRQLVSLQSDATLTLVSSRRFHALPDGVRTLPEAWAGPEHQAQLYRAHDVLVAPSTGEAFGLIPLEALATGLPIVVSAGHGHEAWLPTVEGGAVVLDDVSVAALVKALLYAHDRHDRLRAEALGTSSRLRARWAWPAVAAGIMEALSAV